MPKAKSKRKKTPKSGKSGGTARAAPRSLSPTRAVVIMVAVALAAWGIWSYLGAEQAAERFQQLVAQGRVSLGKVERLPNDGRQHVTDGAIVAYREEMPTSGAHSRKKTNPGRHRGRQEPERLVHSIEHGMVVIYYDAPGDDVMETLESWAGLFGGPWSGIVLTPGKGLGAEVVLTAWRRRLRLAEFDPAAAAAFIDAYRGRGPENRVR